MLERSLALYVAERNLALYVREGERENSRPMLEKTDLALHVREIARAPC